MSDAYDRLRKLAEDATAGPWTTNGVPANVHQNGTNDPVFRGRVGATIAVTLKTALSLEERHANGQYIAAASPDVILGLLDKLHSAYIVLHKNEATVARYEALAEKMREKHDYERDGWFGEGARKSAAEWADELDAVRMGAG